MHIPTLSNKPRNTHLPWRQARDASVITSSNIRELHVAQQHSANQPIKPCLAATTITRPNRPSASQSAGKGHESPPSNGSPWGMGPAWSLISPTDLNRFSCVLEGAAGEKSTGRSLFAGRATPPSVPAPGFCDIQRPLGALGTSHAPWKVRRILDPGGSTCCVSRPALPAPSGARQRSSDVRRRPHPHTRPHRPKYRLPPLSTGCMYRRAEAPLQRRNPAGNLETLN